MNDPKNNSAVLNANGTNVFIRAGSITSTISPSPANTLSSANVVASINSGTVTLNNTNVFSEEFNGKITVAPNTDLVLQTLENIEKLILGAHSSVKVIDLNGLTFTN